jgi:hypothetical protein
VLQKRNNTHCIVHPDFVGCFMLLSIQLIIVRVYQSGWSAGPIFGDDRPDDRHCLERIRFALVSHYVYAACSRSCSIEPDLG